MFLFLRKIRYKLFSVNDSEEIQGYNDLEMGEEMGLFTRFCTECNILNGSVNVKHVF